MVGVPRSAGCPLCVKRRIRCDQARPGCANCARYGVECPGYGRSFKFVTGGKHKVRSNGSRRRRPADAEHRAEIKTGGGGAGSGSDSSGGVGVLELRPTRAQFIDGIIQTLRQGSSADEIVVFAPWFGDVPAHLGTKVALDSAMAAFALHLLGKAEKSDRLVGESRSVYGQSLVALQRALNHPTEWKTAETLCATMTLCLFELFAGTNDPSATSNGNTSPDPSSWMTHAAGVSWLIQQRGAGVYRDSAWDKSMMLSFRTLIIMNSIFCGHDCFLAKKEWQSVLLNLSPEDRSRGVTTEAARVYDRYFAHLARVPAIIRVGLGLREAKRRGLAIDVGQAVALVTDTANLHADYLIWFDEYQRLVPSPVEIPSRDPESIFDTAIHFSNVWHGSLYMGYWTTVFILQTVLVDCAYPVDFTEDNKQLLGKVFRAVETVGKGYMGPYRIGYPVRIAYEFADVPTQVYLLSVLARTEKHYAATSPVGYPRPGTRGMA
ncbi:C6 zinc finger domain protein [Apodospora peruviana]|uniref:C6 zinc finger domain protein n=1 Tax=Apodospora peruviana TaxID=516989 RepID=A0AAE0M7T9_9PEZI|nr:C6 zinc finger domain protein [Apodospora peruviana]